MRKKIYIAAVGMLAITLTSCNRIVKISSNEDLPTVTKHITVNEDFNGIVSKCSADIEYTDGPAKITLTAPEDIIDKLEVKVEDKKLIVTTKDNESNDINIIKIGYKSYGDIKLIVSYQGVNNFTTIASGDIKVGDIEREGISLMTQGSGDIECGRLKSTGLSVLTQGSGDIEVNGATCKDISVTTQGSGDIELKNLFTTTLTALTQGSGDLDISGESTHAELRTMGSGDINAMSFKCSNLKVKETGSGNVNTK